MLRELWPEVVDNLASAVRAGLSLPEALSQLGRPRAGGAAPAFAGFADDYRATGRFERVPRPAQGRLADPVGDRLVESLRIAREVGGSDLGRLLRTLSTFLREDARTRAELETRQGWTVNAARLAVAAPWVVLVLLCHPAASSVQAYAAPAGIAVLARRWRALAWSPTGSWCASVGCPRTSGCCDDAREPALGVRRVGAARLVVAGGGTRRGLALGVCLVVAGLPASRRPGLESALAPYLRDAPRPSRLLARCGPDAGAAGLVQLVGRCCADLGRGVERLLGGAASVRRRLQRAGLPPDVEGFRAEQVVWGIVAGLGAPPSPRCCGPVAAAPWCRWCCSWCVRPAAGSWPATRC